MALGDARNHMKLTYWRVIVAIGLLSSLINSCGPGRNSNEWRDRPPFIKFERRPNKPENSVMASGAPLGVISRSSERFKTKLVRSFDTGIVFKDNERTGADRFMTRRCKNALERLAQLVKDEWEGTVKLRVIDAWDEDAEHEENSLHYEGRALDITTSDKDISKYGKLASLAYFGAKFDWVEYEDGHVHVSCRADGPEDEQSHCFPAQSLVRLPNGDVKRLEDIEIGDQVLTVNEAGKITYSDVIMLMDRRLDIEIHNYVHIETEDPVRYLSLTENHLLYVSETTNSSSALQYARNVPIGVYLSVYIPGTDVLVPAKVRSVTRKTLRGAIAPLTSEGSIIVSDVLSSCYATVEDHTFSHLTFLPWRHLYRLTGQALTNNKQIGMHWYVHLLRTINYLLGLYPNI